MGRASARRLIVTALAAALAAAAVATAAPASSTKLSIDCAGAATANAATGAGNASATCHGGLVGTLTGSGSGTEALPCIDYSGQGSITGPAAAIEIRTAPDQKVCFTAAPATVLRITGHVTVTGGSGTFASAHGTLAFTAHYNRDTGALKVVFAGTVT